MLFKTPTKHTLLTTVLIGFALLPAFFIYFIPLNPTQGVSDRILSPLVMGDKASVSKIEATDIGLPVRLKIPAINVDSVIESNGLTAAGAVEAPKDFSNVSWFNLWPKPGETGSAIISGHYGQVNKKPSVFDNLHKLKKGDKIYVEDEFGKVIVFVVRTIRRYDPKDSVPEIFISNDGKSHLNLITCEGVWDKVFKSYSKRLVIFTDQE